uniref:Protein stoned-A n=1 Tax=Clastoptera arizonana TaxID=38151 RepID=A0A1B6EH49_9HEMI
MLKIKGLKKKKKGKKGKHKEEELFNSAELEEYRHKLEAEGATGEPSSAPSSAEQSDEWQKFKALTAGVDSVLKKTQDDLDRIKTTSYFQKKSPKPEREAKKEVVEPPKSKSKKWIGFEEGGGGAAEEEEEKRKEPEAREDVKAEQQVDDKTEVHISEEEEEEESEKDDDLFDTSYVDVVASGEVKLAYIPDSPVEEDGFDPFDTSIVDTVIRVDPKKSKLISLGCAVDVLTGRVEKPSCVDLEAKKRRRAKKQDLLLGSFDEGDVVESVCVSVSDEPTVKTILDEEPDVVIDEIDLSINLATALLVPSPSVEVQQSNNLETEANKEIITTFELEDDLDDEFSALAAESIQKTITVVNEDLTCIEDSLETFEDSDPFDTSFASNVLPGKCELKIIEQEFLSSKDEVKQTNVIDILEKFPSIQINDSSFNEHNFLDEDQTPLTYKHRDLLGGSTTDLSKIGHSPIEPACKEDSEITYSDPFDTSVVDVLVAPGKAELKFLEKELLDTLSDVKGLDSDDDFDPRADSPPKVVKPLTRPDQLPVGEKRLSIPKVVAFNIDSLKVQQDLLAVGEEEGAKISKPLTPYYADVKDLVPSAESDKSFIDPFDTSYVTHNPGKVELKLIESELVGSDLGLKRTDSDEDFNPRSETITVKPSVLSILSLNKESARIEPDILSKEEIITTKLHTPVVPRKIEEDLNELSYSDPFDTSVIDTLVAPGKAELKLLESELIATVEPVASITRSYTDQDFDPRNKPEGVVQENFIDHVTEQEVTEKVLTPQSATNKVSFAIGDDIDPFDTSCVDSLVPGKIELKLLESELIHN